MKIFFLIAGFLVLAMTSYSQQSHSKPLTQEDYLEKSKNQRTAGYIVLGLGTVAFLTPIIIYASDPYFDVTELNSAVGPLSVLVGAGMMVGSVGFFIVSGTNKRKAMSLTFKNETVPYIQDGSLLTRGVPSLSLKIGL